MTMTSQRTTRTVPRGRTRDAHAPLTGYVLLIIYVPSTTVSNNPIADGSHDIQLLKSEGLGNSVLPSKYASGGTESVSDAP